MMALNISFKGIYVAAHFTVYLQTALLIWPISLVIITILIPLIRCNFCIRNRNSDHIDQWNIWICLVFRLEWLTLWWTIKTYITVSHYFMFNNCCVVSAYSSQTKDGIVFPRLDVSIASVSINCGLQTGFSQLSHIQDVQPVAQTIYLLLFNGIIHYCQCCRCPWSDIPMA